MYILQKHFHACTSICLLILFFLNTVADQVLFLFPGLQKDLISQPNLQLSWNSMTELWPVEGRQKWGTPPPEGSPKGTYPLFCTVLLSCGWLLMFAREWRTLKAYRHVRGGSRHESSLKGEPLGRTSNPHETAVLSGCGLFGVVYYSRCSVNYRKTYTNKIRLSVCVHVMCACMLSHFSCVRLFGTLWTVAH